MLMYFFLCTLRWRHNGCHSVSNPQPHDCLLNRLFRRRSKNTSKLRVTGLCTGNSAGTGEFAAQMACNAENVSIWWRHHVAVMFRYRSVLIQNSDLYKCMRFIKIRHQEYQNSNACLQYIQLCLIGSYRYYPLSMGCKILRTGEVTHK